MTNAERLTDAADLRPTTPFHDETYALRQAGERLARHRDCTCYRVDPPTEQRCSDCPFSACEWR